MLGPKRTASQFSDYMDKYGWQVDGPITDKSLDENGNPIRRGGVLGPGVPVTGESEPERVGGHLGPGVPNEGITQGYFDNANKFVLNHLVDLNNVGTASYVKPKIAQSGRSRMDMFSNGAKEDGNELPVGPGNTYLTHLFDFHKVGKKMQEQQNKHKPKSNIYTDQQEALRTALSIVGCYSDRNPGGMPIEVNDATKIWFGDKEVSPQDNAMFRSTIETGDNKMDPKKVRKFVNHDGSLTWEVLNDDKTVMSRFTMGEYSGKKIFAQGGYKAFAELLNQAKEKMGPDSGGEFDAIRSAFSGA